MCTQRKRRTNSLAALAATTPSATTSKDRPFLTRKKWYANALEFSRPNLLGPDLLGTAEGGSRAPINQPLAPVAARLRLQSTNEVRRVGAQFGCPRSITLTHKERHFDTNVATGDGFNRPVHNDSHSHWCDTYSSTPSIFNINPSKGQLAGSKHSHDDDVPGELCGPKPRNRRGPQHVVKELTMLCSPIKNMSTDCHVFSIAGTFTRVPKHTTRIAKSKV